jgi:hypothetical protein
MPTRAEVLSAYTIAATREIYIETINQSLNLFPQRSANFTMINNFVQRRVNRLTAIYESTILNSQNDTTINNYTIFKDTVDKMRGQLEELDQKNGRVNRTILGDTRAQRSRRREMAELNIRKAALLSSVLDNIETHIAEMNILIQDIQNTQNVA